MLIKKSVWSVNNQRKAKQPVCRALQSNGIAYLAPTDINEIWFEHCSNVFEHSTFDETGRAEELTMKVASIRKEANQSKAEDKMTIDLQDIKTICSSLRSGKACGHDKISYEHLKYGGNLLHKHLCHLFNLCIDLSYIPGEGVLLFFCTRVTTSHEPIRTPIEGYP